MKNLESKALEHIYQDVKIHFLLSNRDNVMVNATEMAKAFGKRTDHFLQNESTKLFINAIKVPEMSGTLIDNRGRNGIYFNEVLAFKFAAWLDPNFEVWVYKTIKKILLGHYKEHWDAHIKQEDAKERMEKAKSKLLLEATQEDAIAYFEAEKEYKNAKNEKLKAIQSQYKLFDNL